MTTPIGYVPVQIIPVIDGLSKAMERQLGPLPTLGKNAGKLMGANIAAGVRASESDVKRAFDAHAKLADRAADATGKLRTAEAQLQQLRATGANDARIVAASERAEKARRDEARATRVASDALKDYERSAKSAANAGDGGGAGGGLLSKLKGTAGGARSAGGEAAAGFVEGFGGPIASLGTKGGTVGLALAAAAALGLGAGALLAKNIGAGMEQQQSIANVQAKLGLDDATMKHVADASAKAYAGNFGESVAANMDAARAAIQSGLIDPRASASATQQVVQQLNTVSSVMGEDIPNVSRAAAQAIRTGLAKNATEAFDLLVKGTQSGLNVSEDLLDTVTEYGTQFRKLGLDGPEAFGLMNQAVKGGARDTDIAADALKEFSIRAVDGTKTSSAAYQAAGLDAQKYTELIAQGGPVAKQAFGEVLAAVKGVTDPAKQAQIAVGLFGTQAEDLGGALQNFDLSTAVQQLGQVDGAARHASDTIGGTTASSFEALKRTVETALGEVQLGLANAFGPQLQQAADWVSSHVPQIIEWLGKIGSTALHVGADIGQFVAGALDVLAMFQEVTGRVTGTVANALGGLMKGIGGVVGVFDEDMGRSITSAGNLLDEYGDVAFHSADTLRGFADVVRSGSNAMNRFGDDVGAAAHQAAQARTFTDALATSVASIPDGKDIILTDNSPETIANLAKIGIAVSQTPTGLKLTATTDAAQSILDAFRAQETGKPIAPQVKPDLTQANADMKSFLEKWQGAVLGVKPPPGSAPAPAAPGSSAAPGNNPLLAPYGRSGGGVVDPSGRISGPGSGTSDSILAAVVGGPGGMIRVSNEESINTAASTRANWPVIDAMNNGANLASWFTTLPAFATGGAVSPDVAAANALVGTEYSQGNRTDCSGMAARVISRALGLPETGLMSTKNAKQWLTDRGFKPGTGGPGQISVGWYDHGPNPNDGHMAMTLSDGSHAEAGGKNGVFTIGAAAQGADGPQFDQHMFLPTTYGEGPAGNGSVQPLSAAGSGGGGGAAVDAPASGGAGGGGVSLPSSFSGLASMGLGGLGVTTRVTPDSPERTFDIGGVASEAIGGQVQSALGVFGINDSPPWLQAASKLIGGIKVSGADGTPIFDGSNLFGGGGQSAAPLSAASLGGGTPPPDDDVKHGARAGQQPGPTYNITARDTEDAFIKAQRIEREKAATKLDRF